MTSLKSLWQLFGKLVRLTATCLAWVVLLVGIAACEDVIEVETPEEDPRLVVEGLIRVDTTQEFVPVEIRLTQTAGFFGETQPVTDATDVVISLQVYEDGVPTSTSTKNLTQLEPGSGLYVPDPSFMEDQRIRVSTVVENDILYTLVLTWNGRRYAARARYYPAVPIESVRQGDQTLFDEEETELIITYTDAPDRDDYYIFDFGFGEFLPTEDTFYKGQSFEFSFFYDQEFEPGTELEIGIFGADQQLYNYMNLLVEQAGGFDGPFQTPAATVRGNIFDVTGIDNIDMFDNTGRPEDFALGYFAFVQEFTATHIIE